MINRQNEGSYRKRHNAGTPIHLAIHLGTDEQKPQAKREKESVWQRAKN